MNQHPGLFAGGHWRVRSSASDAGTPPSALTARSCADGSTLGVFATCTPGEVADATVAAAGAAAALATMTPTERAVLLRALADELDARVDELAPLISHEVGTPVAVSRRLQVGLPAVALRSYADAAETLRWSNVIGNSEVSRKPVGVVAAITPWNYPIHQVVMKVGAAMGAGCPIVIKPGEIGLNSLALLVEATQEAGFPAGAVNVVLGGADVAQALINDPHVDHVSFTGSPHVGGLVAEAASRRLLPTTLELGGKSASIVLPDAELQPAVKSSVGNAFLNSGQTCTAWSRLLVPKNSAAQVAELAIQAAEKLTVGHPLDPETRLGPLATRGLVDRAASLATKGGDGAQLIFESELNANLPAGNYSPARIVTDVDPSSALGQEEVFGPVLAIITYETVDQAITIANGTKFGLTAAVWGPDDEADRVAGQMDSGMVDINGAAFNPAAPFGGRKSSGFGRELGQYGIENLTYTQSVQRRSAS